MKLFRWMVFNMVALVGTCAPLEADAKHIYGIVLAGGSGERLWPLSHAHKPKQFLALGSEKTLLEQSFDRLRGIAAPENLWAVTSQKHQQRVSDYVGNSIGTILVEPSVRNNGPAVLLTCLQLYAQDPKAIAVFVPADAFIPPSAYGAVEDALCTALEFAAAYDTISIFGVTPTYAATGYGYIEYEPSNARLHTVKKFHEKPTLAVAQEYLTQSNMLWNIGMFVGRVSNIIEEFRRHAPKLYSDMIAYRGGLLAYDELESISVDYAVMERSDRVSVLPVNFSWCDVGNLEVFLSLKNQYEGDPGKLVQVEAHNNLINVPNKLVAIVGLDDLCVVETPNELLIARRSDVEKVRAVVAILKQEKLIEYI